MMIVDESRRLYVWDVTTQYMIELWTDYGFGQKPDIVPRSPELRAVWDEFWNADENQYIFNERKLNELSNKLQVDGEYWFVQFISKLDGQSTIRIIETDDIKDIYYDNDDLAVPVYYKRQWWTTQYNSEEHTLYYRDYRATDEQAESVRQIIKEQDSSAQFAEEQNINTDVLVFHVKFREIEGRGWPFLTAGFAWSRGYKGFLEDRATINKAAASVVEKVKVKGGQRMVDYVKQSLQSSLVNGSNRQERNPPPASGSIWVENQALDREWLNKPTNAADAEKDGIAILSQVALAGKIYPHYLGRGEYYRLATATAMEGPTFRSFQRYQSFWSSVWRTMVQMIAKAKEKYANANFNSMIVDVNTDRIIDTDVKEITSIMTGISDALTKGSIDPSVAINSQQALIRLAMQTLGVPNDVDIVGDIVVDITSSELQEAMSEGGYMEYAQRIRGLVYGLWAGSLDEMSFIDGMNELIDFGLTKAWRNGMQDAGLNWDDRTPEEQIALAETIFEQMQYVPGFANYIATNNKASGHLLRETDYRSELWANAFQAAYNKAIQMASNDPKNEWILGPAESHCRDCLKYAGKVKRASYWQKIGAVPQSPELACKGINCKCRFEITDKPLSRGYLTPPKG